ncbi:hypothetical protein Tsubulata_049509, partial [Turnera subulata]
GSYLGCPDDFVAFECGVSKTAFAAEGIRKKGRRLSWKCTSKERSDRSCAANARKPVLAPYGDQCQFAHGIKELRPVIRHPRYKTEHKVYIRGRNKEEEEALELEVYKQGATKTELYNKWQETGACPYGDQCQFAHSIKELRPVIRHPRYKTEVCRMVLSGDTCPLWPPLPLPPCPHGPGEALGPPA